MATGYTDRMQPTQLGPYTIGTRLGRGGMGAVFEATDAAGHRVAVKLLASHLADDVGLRRRFDAEIATLKTLRHPGIVQLLAFGEEDDQPYFAMELVPGQSLEQLLRAGRRFTWQETVSVALGVCRALKAAHDQGVVHRDLKPANLLVADGDGANLGDRVKLADFGIAKLFGSAAHTAHGNIVGTAEYMAPEQATGGPVDHRVDIYALGLVMFAMLTGKPPFTGTQAAEILRRQQHAPPPRISAVVAGVPPELDQLIDRLLAKSPAARPANALALGRLLTAIETLHVPAPVAETGPLTPLPPSHDLLEPGSTAPIDLYAPTQAVPVAGATAAAPPPPAQTAAATGALAGNTTKPVEVAAVAGTGFDPASATVVDRSPRKRFTTVEELDRVATAREARARGIEQRWQAVVALVTLVALVGGGYFLLRKPSAEQLFGRIDAARRAAAQGGDLRDAGPAIEEFLRRFPDDPRVAQVAALDRTLAVDRLEKRARRRPLGVRPLSPLERDYRAAMDRESDSPSACREALDALVAVHTDAATAGSASPPIEGESAIDATLWIDLARRQLERLGPAAAQEQAEDARRIAELFQQADALAAQAAAEDSTESPRLLARRRELLQSIVELYETRSHAAAAVATAREKLAAP